MYSENSKSKGIFKYPDGSVNKKYSFISCISVASFVESLRVQPLARSEGVAAANPGWVGCG